MKDLGQELFKRAITAEKPKQISHTTLLLDFTNDKSATNGS
jgi:hypothetical protein